MNKKRQLLAITLGTTFSMNAAQAIEIPATVHLKDAIKAPLDASSPVVLVVDQETHQTHVLQYIDQALYQVLSVPNCTGKPGTPTPNCRAKIVQKELDPRWKPPASIDPKQTVVEPFSRTKKNPLGVANLRLNIDHGMIALHGTNEPKRIGQAISHGCIRHLNQDILTIYKIVHLGTPVYIVPRTDDAVIPVTEFQNNNTVAKNN